jgi:hypothetical protein
MERKKSSLKVINQRIKMNSQNKFNKNRFQLKNKVKVKNFNQSRRKQKSKTRKIKFRITVEKKVLRIFSNKLKLNNKEIQKVKGLWLIETNNKIMEMLLLTS